MSKIKVLIVDDSAVVRQVLQSELDKQLGIEVVATAADPFIARDKLVNLRPDVIILDIEMPRMDGLQFLQKIQKHFPTPTIILSSLTPAGGEMALDALEMGAFDVLSKPGGQYSVGDVVPILTSQIRAAALKGKKNPRIELSGLIKKEKSVPPIKSSLKLSTNQVIAIGASTGGTQAIQRVLSSLPKTTPGVVIVQHMPIGFTEAFAKRLNSISELEVREAQTGDTVCPGVALIAPGNQHMQVVRSGSQYKVLLDNGPREHYQRPAVDPLFRSVAKNVGKNAIGVLLTGMGSDGAAGLLDLKNQEAPTIIQSEESSVVWGMPGAAAKINAETFCLDLPDIAPRIINLIEQHREKV